ncbi:hypothetical protein POTOM_033612 [Populus tomentosa]|uniref:Histidine-containing phosphotransfer protein n=1 Tax=Populus tomentosa TaxID=118781 RepID=A0A8X7Z6L0_POPTO|nr:hypothetical protein POTOM_033612 [Populus tomentosa]
MLGQTHKQSSCCLILLPFLHRESIQLVAIQLYMDFGVAEEVEWKHLTGYTFLVLCHVALALCTIQLPTNMNDGTHLSSISFANPMLGIVNAQFCHIQTLKTEEEPDRVVRLINTYCIDVESILFELGSYIDLPDVDFSKLAALAQQVEERSSLMGAEHMRLACADLIQACRQMDKRNLSLSFNWIKNEFAHIRTKLEVVVQGTWDKIAGLLHFRTLVYRSVVFERVREIHNYTKHSPSSRHMQIVFKFLVLHNNFCFTVCPCSNTVWCTNVLLPTFNETLVLLVDFSGPHWFVDGAEDYAT